MNSILKPGTCSFSKNVIINNRIWFNSINKIAFTFVLLYKVIAALHNYHKDFPCTHLVGAKH